MDKIHKGQKERRGDPCERCGSIQNPTKKESFVPCHVCKRAVPLDDAALVEGRVVCPRHSGGDAGVRPGTTLEPGVYKYVRMRSGRVVFGDIERTSHRQMVRDAGGSPLSAGAIVVLDDHVKIIGLGSTGLGLRSAPDDLDVLAVTLGMPKMEAT